MIVKKIKKRLRYIKNTVYLIIDFAYDAYRYAKYAHFGNSLRNEHEHHGVVTMEYHRIEKGLTLPNFRPYFGIGVIKSLLSTLKTYPAYSNTKPHLHAIESINSYLSFHESQKLPETAEAAAELPGIRRALAELSTPMTDARRGPVAGATLVSGPDVIANGQGVDFDRFMNSRHSTRDFDTMPVDRESLLAAVEIALRAPSVCNRQAWQCHFTSDPHVIQLALEQQNGNAGFRSSIPALCIVTSRLNYFVSPGERFQPWIDGGIFSMSLILALHSQGLGSCCLNWSVGWKRDLSLRRAVKIPDDENVIMMLAIGHLKPEYSVCVSPRRPATDVLRYLES